MRQAAPVDRTVHPHQRDRVQVADDAVGFDWLVGHFLTGLSKIGLKRGRDHFRHSERKSQFQAGAHSQGQVPLPASGLRQSLSLRSRASAATKLSFELAGSRLGGATFLALDDPMNSLDQCSREPGSVPLYPSKKTSGVSLPRAFPSRGTGLYFTALRRFRHLALECCPATAGIDVKRT